MANELIKMKTGTIAKLEQETNGAPEVALERGAVYFAVDTDAHIGKIVYDAPVGASGVDRIVMSSESEYADYAKEAGKATGITGIYPVKGTQTATTANWTGVIHGVNELFDGLTIAYYLPRKSDSNVTLNLTFENGSTSGAIPVYYTGTSRMTTHYGAGSTIILTYWSAGSISADGTAIAEARWTHSEYDSTNVYQLRANYGNFKPTTALYSYQILLTKNDTELIPINAVKDSVATNKTLTTEEFNPFGPIFYWNTTNAINADAVIGDWTNLYSQVLADFRYSFNIGQTLTANKAVYLVAVPQSNGMAKLDTTPIVQDLPTTADNKIYIYLGQSNSGYQVELVPVHPVYYYKNGKIALYTGEPEASPTSSGLMSAADKAKLDGIAAGAQANSVTGVKGNSESTYRTGNVNITKANIGLGNVENKSSATIRGEITSSNVTTALGYTPATQDVATSTSDGLMSSTDKTKFDSMKVDDIVGSEPISVSISNRKATVTHDKKGPSTSSNTGKGDTTNQAPGFGESFKVTSGTVDVYGHTTAFAEHTVTIPATEASTSVKGLMTTGQVTKLNGIATGAEVNQNAFANVKVGSTTIAADTKQDTLELVGSNVTLTPDATNDKVTIGITKNNVTSALGYTPPTTNTTYGVATSSADGLMSSTDKANFDSGVGIAGTTVSIGGSISAATLRTNLGLSNALHFIGKATVAITDGSTTDPVISGYSTKTAGDVIIDKDNSREYVWDGAKWEELGPDGSYSLVDHTHPDATTSNAGFMTATMVSKLNGIASGATKTTISATAPISASASTGAVSITHNTSGVTAQAYGETGNKTPGFGSTFSVPSFTVDATGHVTVAGSHTVKIPNAAATTSAAGLMSKDDKSKLSGIASSAQVNVLESVKMNGTALTITSKAVDIPLMGGASASAGGSVGVVPAPTAGDQTAFLRGDGTWVVPDNTTYSVATTSAAGLMSADDKTKLDGIAAGAKTGTVTSVATGAGLTGGTITTSGTIKANLRSETKLTNNSAAATEVSGRVYPVALDKTGYLAVNVPWVAYSNASASAAGLMTSTHYSKLEGIASGAQVNVIESVKMNNTALTITSKAVNIPVMGAASSSAAGSVGVVPAPGAGKQTSFLRGDGTWVVPDNTTYSAATTSAAGLMSADDKTKLDGISAGAKTGTVTKVSTGAGLTGGDITTSGTIKAKLKSETKLTNDSAAATETSGRVYPVALDKSGNLAVNVPWVAYGEASASSAGLMSTAMYSKLAGIATGATANTGTVTKVTAGSGLKIGSATSGGDITTTGTINHINSVTAKTAAAQAAKTLTWGGTFTLYEEKYDSTGHVTGVASYNMTMPATPPDTKNTAGSSNSDSKLFLIGATSQATSATTYSDSEVFTTNGTLSAKILSTSAGVNANTANSGTAGGLSLYGTTSTDYGIAMRQTGTSTGQLGKHGFVQGDWAGYFSFTGATNRGYIFRHAGANVASINGEGKAVFNGSVTVGGNAANTAGVKMEYNSTTKSLDFIFA